MIRQGICLLLFCTTILASLVNAQEPSTDIAGYIIDEAASFPLSGASVFLIGDQDSTATTSDNEGFFLFENIAPGRYSLLIEYLGYESIDAREIYLESGRNLELNFSLVQSASDLPPTVVRGYLNRNQGDALASVQTLTIEEVRRFPATFNDPARLAQAYPGVLNANDQANEMIIRGNSPAGVGWRLEGVEIVNPNHLSNAGNQFDRISDSGGGVNALSAQMLSNTTFLTGAFPTQYGNAIAGVLDMNLRAGNHRKWEATAQVGLLGLDFSFEGPFSKKSKASYLINYRYSTIGLLDALGVEVSEEAISFQDLSLNINLPHKKLGTLNIFGIGGSSSNVLTAELDSTLWESQRDRSNIDYQSRLAILGLSHEKRFNQLTWKTSAVYSTNRNTRDEAFYDDALVLRNLSEELVEQSKLGIHSFLKYYTKGGLKIQFGVEANQYIYLLSPSLTPDGLFFENKSEAWQIAPYLSLGMNIGEKLKLYSGIRFTNYSQTKTSLALPRLGMAYALSKKDKLSLSWGTQSKILPGFLTLYQAHLNAQLNQVQSDQVVLSYKHEFKNASFISTEIYWQNISDAATFEDSTSTFSSINLEEIYIEEPGQLMSQGMGKNIGIELSYQQYLEKGVYYLLNGSIYNSQYRNGSADWRDSRYNGNYIFNATMGKEFSWNKKWNKTLGINLRYVIAGGQRYTPIDLPTSIASGTQVFDLDNAYSMQYPLYTKADFRIYIRTSKPKRSTSLSLDIQNIFNRKNAAFYTYDPTLETVELKTQLGLIPILNWRIEL